MSVERFSLPFIRSSVDDLRERLQRTRWPDELPASDWALGFDRQFLVDLCSYWKDEFDWKAQIDRLSAFKHYKYQADEVGIHFIHERGKGPDPMPLILTHGWPGSFVEMLKVIPLLTDPAAHGYEAADSFDVIVPSLPGYGFQIGRSAWV